MTKMPFRYFLYHARVACTKRVREELKALDREREQSAGWYRSNEVLGMMLYTNCFAGNLRGVREKLPYLKEAGVTYITSCPVLAVPRALGRRLCGCGLSSGRAGARHHGRLRSTCLGLP